MNVLLFLGGLNLLSKANLGIIVSPEIFFRLKLHDLVGSFATDHKAFSGDDLSEHPLEILHKSHQEYNSNPIVSRYLFVDFKDAHL